MRLDAPALLAAVERSHGRDARGKLVDDPRLTPLGRCLKQARVDEAPQLLNVLRGEMALVGPRPHSARWAPAWAS
jgi:lipopolysaccharide/colanic/teichoic acid biosynthesis glycosyltransferase